MSRVQGSLKAVAAASVAALCASSALAGGTVTGKVLFDGEVKPAPRIKVQGDAYCVDAHKDAPLLKEDFVINAEKKTLCNVIVYVSSPVSGSFPAPAEAAVLDQVGCQYTPHVSGVMVGQTMQFKNSDATAHNLNLKAENNSGFNEGQPTAGMVKDVTFSKPEFENPMALKCDVHSWMNAYIAVFPHPFFAVTDENGEFKIEGLPAGKHTLTVWHEFDRFAPAAETIEIEVPEGGVVEAEFTYAPVKKG